MEETNTNNKKTCTSKVKAAVIYFSLGKYRTPLFYNKQDSYSSFISGVASLIFISIMLLISILIFIPIFNHSQWMLDRKNVPLYRMKSIGTGNLVNETCEKCRLINIKQAIQLIDQFTYNLYDEELTGHENCSEIYSIEFESYDDQQLDFVFDLKPETDAMKFKTCSFIINSTAIINLFHKFRPGLEK